MAAWIWICAALIASGVLIIVWRQRVRRRRRKVDTRNLRCMINGIIHRDVQ